MLVKMPIDRMDDLFRRIASSRKLYMPVQIQAENAGGASDTKKEAAYQEWTEGTVYSDVLNTLKSAKEFFFPQIQDMAKFRMKGKTIQVIDDRKETEDYVIFGVRACDVRSFDVLDKVFLADPVDTYYQDRRKHGTIFSMACSRPGETCFCRSFGIDPSESAGDVQCWKDQQMLYLQPVTKKGEALIGELMQDGLLQSAEPGDEAKIGEIRQQILQIMDRLPLRKLQPVDNRDRELQVFRSEQWKELSSHCLGCGSCTFVCPTCQCFDIEEFSGPDTVQRYRCWDSCMYKDFTMMAAGQPRKTQLERFRQRFMHKLVYYPAAHDGMYSCVGCGRCLRKCPIHMNIAKVMTALEQEFPEQDREEKA